MGCSGTEPPLLVAPVDAKCPVAETSDHFYARCKGLLNLWRRRPGRNACEGWCAAGDAMARARPLPAEWSRAPVPF